LWDFFNGAFYANSGGRVKEEDFHKFNLGQLQAAEAELIELAAIGVSAFALGTLADAGYVLHGQTKQNDPERPDDEQHRLLAFELLDSLY